MHNEQLENIFFYNFWLGIKKTYFNFMDFYQKFYLVTFMYTK